MSTIKNVVTTATCCVITAALVTVSYPRIAYIQEAMKTFRITKQSVVAINSEIAQIDSDLSTYGEKYDNNSFSSNEELAKVMANLGGAKFVSVTAVAEDAGSDIDCAETAKLDDVVFFSSTATKMRFKYTVKDLAKFTAALKNSAVPVISCSLNGPESVAEVSVRTVAGDGATTNSDFNTDKQRNGKDITNELSKSEKSDGLQVVK